MYWRLATAARALVPCPFRPTPLQCSVNMPNLAIDFVNWPEIRDQMLLAGTSIELDAVYRDLVLNTVIEIPEKQVAVNVYRQFHTSIDANSPRPSCDSSEPGPPTSAVDPGWVFFEINREDPDFQSWTPDPVEEALARMLWRWIQRLSHHHDLSLFRATSVDDAAKVTVPESPLGLLDSKFCKKRTSIFDALANTKDWRLSKEFAAKYPFMDCSSGMFLHAEVLQHSHSLIAYSLYKLCHHSHPFDSDMKSIINSHDTKLASRSVPLSLSLTEAS